MKLKPEARVIGFDDSPFEPHSRGKPVPVIGVVMRGGHYVEAILANQVHVDGRDSTSVLERMLLNSRYLDQLKGIIIDGVALGGFNIVDIFHISRVTNLPVISVTRNEPDMESIFRALIDNFQDGVERAKLVKQGELVNFKLNSDRIDMTLWGKYAGTDYQGALDVLNHSIIRGAMPEPLRIAHLIGSAIVKGESRGRA